MSFAYTGQELTTDRVISAYIHLIVKELFKEASSYKKQLRKYANTQLEKTAGTSAFWKANMAADMCSAHYKDILARINQLDKEYSISEKFDVDDRYKFLDKYTDILDDYKTNYLFCI